MIHLHVRDARGNHTLDPDLYRSATAAIQRAVGERLVIQMSSEAGGMRLRQTRARVRNCRGDVRWTRARGIRK